jgi:hypothetical protein
MCAVLQTSRLGDRAGYAAVGSQVEHKGYSPTHPAKAKTGSNSSSGTGTTAISGSGSGSGYVAPKPTIPKPFNLHGSGSGAPAEHKVQRHLNHCGILVLDFSSSWYCS